MFSGLLFLIQTLLILSYSYEVKIGPESISPFFASLIGLGIFSSFILTLRILFKVYFKSIRHSRVAFLIANFGVLFFLLFYHFIIVAHRIYAPLSSQFIHGSISLFFFFFTLYTLDISFPKAPLKYARFFLPFIIPFLVFSSLSDISQIVLYYTYSGDDFYTLLSNDSFFFAATIIIIALLITTILLFLPPLVISIWNCPPISNSKKKLELEEFCKKNQIKHGGLKSWSMLPYSYTAGIIGILPKYRYFMLTPVILTFPIEQLKAILTHEIGHLYRKHIILFPIIIFGFVLLSLAFSLFFLPAIDLYFTIQNRIYPNFHWKTLLHISILVPNLLLLALYVRFYFGFFSRLFERQADLHCFVLSENPKYLCEALENVALKSKIPQTQPSWHHFSIKNRIDFIEKASKNPNLASLHHKKTKFFFLSHLFLSLLISLYLFFSIYPEKSPTKQILIWNQNIQNNIINSTSKRASEQLSITLLDFFSSLKNPSIAKKIHNKALRTYTGSHFPGIAEYYTAKSLFKMKLYNDSALFMIKGWKLYDFTPDDTEVKESFTAVSNELIKFSSFLESDNVQQLLFFTQKK